MNMLRFCYSPRALADTPLQRFSLSELCQKGVFNTLAIFKNLLELDKFFGQDGVRDVVDEARGAAQVETRTAIEGLGRVGEE
jgi:hypothetical protein